MVFLMVQFVERKQWRAQRPRNDTPIRFLENMGGHFWKWSPSVHAYSDTIVSRGNWEMKGCRFICLHQLSIRMMRISFWKENRLALLKNLKNFRLRRSPQTNGHWKYMAWQRFWDEGSKNLESRNFLMTTLILGTKSQPLPHIHE